MRTWLGHLRSLKPISMSLGLVALLIAALFIFAMFKERDYSVIPMGAALMASILALAIFLPPRISNYSYGLILVLLGVRSLVVGSVWRYSRQDEPLLYWLSILFLFACAGVFFHAAYRVRNSPAPPEPTNPHDGAG